MEVSISEIIRETRNAVNYRLDMLESIIKNSCKNTSVNDKNNTDVLTERIYNVESTLYRFNDLLSNVIDKIKNMEKHTYIPPLKTPSRDEIIPEVFIEENTDRPILTVRSHHDDNGEDSHVEKTCIVDKVELEKEAEEEVAEEEVAEEEEEVAEEEEEEEVAEEEEEEEEQMELEEFEYKGMTLYRDAENKVYQMDEEGSLSDPIGVWDESGPKPRIKKLIL
jgi:hypothetical protein